MEKEIKKDELEIDEKDSETIKAIKEGYKKKIETLKETHKKEMEELEAKLEKKHAEQIRSLFLDGDKDDKGSGGKQKDEDDKELSFFEQVEKATKEKLKI